MKFTEEHLWLRFEDDAVVVGLTEYGAELLGEITFVELPDEGDALVKDDEAVVIEGEETTSDLLAPLSGEIVEVNTALEDRPALINDDPLGDGWLFKMAPEDIDQMDEYLDEASYKKLVR